MSGSIFHRMDKIIFDLDGTLLDSRKRLHTLFKDLVPELNLSFNEYWDIKMTGTSHKELINSKIGELSDFDYKVFHESWMHLIESPEYLAIDKPYSKSRVVLEALQNKGIKMFLCTARQKISGVEQQLEEYNLSSYFEDIYVTEQKKTKKELLINNINWGDSFFVGDTSQDIQLAKSFGGVSIAVTSGFRSREYLSRFNPDYLIKNISQLAKLLKNESRL